MPKTYSKYVCQQCGGQYPTGYGRCPGCGSWHSLVETVDRPAATRTGFPRVASSAVTSAVPLAEVESSEYRRLRVPMEEFNRVLGGGIVPGSLVLLGGDPGIGKSTLLLQVADKLSATGAVVLYVSGEESEKQIKLRGERLGVQAPNLLLMPETNLENIFREIERLQPNTIIVDSIQT